MANVNKRGRGPDSADESPITSEGAGVQPVSQHSREGRATGVRRKPRRRAIRLAIFGAVVWFLPSIITHSPLLSYALRLATADLDGTLSVQSVSLGWLSPVSVTGIEVNDRKGRPVLSIASLRGDRALAMILCNYSNLGRFDLYGVKLSAVVRDDGSNVEDILSKYIAPKPPKPPEKKSSTDFAVGVRIADASISITDQPSGQTWQTTKFALAFDMLEGATGPINGSAEIGLKSCPATTSGAGVSPSWAAGTATPQTDQGGAATIAGTMKVAAGQCEINLRASDFPLAVFRRLVNRFSPATTLTGRLSTQVRLAWSGKEKGTVPICRNGPEGASHKWGLSPFPRRRSGFGEFFAGHARLAAGRASPRSFAHRLPGVVPGRPGGD